MIIDCISDLHGFYPKLEGGDLLIVAGDLTAKHTEKEHFEFNEWLEKQRYEKIIVIAGNHDPWIEENECLGIADFDGQCIEYLQDSGTEFKGLKIWGSPWSKTFVGINPKCKAFTVDTEEELADKFEKIPYDIDILITHSPPFMVLDKIETTTKKGYQIKYAGSKHLHGYLKYACRPKLHVFGHIHEGYGQRQYFSECISVNASMMNDKYQPINKPIRIEL